ncbi:2-phosphosulfolactate phosphatase family protein [cyanobacterium endosymbiont of Epithemia clementina EcSB]|uniref:2-phosphosulfolactate phosphatase family protein n=1 Tax=cyanobacterium endosymbiont of Epithemia clementina EcSB TaxID=3034674 RepID=UPI0024810788|nr:2-phosphosulfolactate phosphatase family protein [cyanobacterium endosymbiont of Epithemia clementina EcSB]WGT68329.1 2-phosphosulfolactate phosphatase family protein [cyanobacterium endosymbiont of Epithemia clementina EcSB]
MKLFVYHTPELIPPNNLPECAVVIDILPATTTIATALNAGAEAVQVFSNIDNLREASDCWLPKKSLRAGERGGAQIEGFDLDNSPLVCTPEIVGDKRLFLTTTNGTRALQKVKNSTTVITSAMVNRQATVRYLLGSQPETIGLIGSGWQGGYSIEDTMCAGAIAPALLSANAIIVGNDEVIAAVALYTQWKENLLELFSQASHGQRLLRANHEEDLIYCAKTDVIEVLPIQKEPGVLVKLS